MGSIVQSCVCKIDFYEKYNQDKKDNNNTNNTNNTKNDEEKELDDDIVE